LNTQLLFSIITLFVSCAGKPCDYCVPEKYLETCPVALGFDFPVGKPNAKGYYDAQSFGKNNHLGSDWNGNGGGNSDLGDDVFAIADGVVFYSENFGGGWGNIIRIVHNIGTKTTPVYVESLYAHFDKILVSEGAIIKRGQKIGTIGNAGGIYLAHLHLEIRTQINMEIGGGYATNKTGFTDPTIFINARRPKSGQ
jgi:murein DD-endopeptidase MepM/ murein hydrolase activator NlpD